MTPVLPLSYGSRDSNTVPLHMAPGAQPCTLAGKVASKRLRRESALTPAALPLSLERLARHCTPFFPSLGLKGGERGGGGGRGTQNQEKRGGGLVLSTRLGETVREKRHSEDHRSMKRTGQRNDAISMP